MKLRLLFLAAAASAAASGANFPVGTYVYAGSVLNYRHEVMAAEDGLTVQAVTQDGAVLASCKVTDPVVSSGVNFMLEVPVSTESSAKSAAIGDALNCVVLSESGVTNVSPRPLPAIAAANAITNLNLVSAGTTPFAYKDRTVQVANDYLAGIASYMAAEGRAAYDAAADWDGDGASNYEEYLAGTNPFDPSDRLRIIEFRRNAANAILSFEYAGGHLYAIDATTSLTNKTWSAARFSVGSASAVEQETVYHEGSEDETVGLTTIYLTPAADAPSMFYSLRAE